MSESEIPAAPLDRWKRIREEVAGLRQRSWIEQLAADRLDACIVDLSTWCFTERQHHAEREAELIALSASHIREREHYGNVRFLDGHANAKHHYTSEVATLTQQLTEARAVLRSLMKESIGILALAESDLRDVVGHTNVVCWRTRIEEAGAVLDSHLKGNHP